MSQPLRRTIAATTLGAYLVQAPDVEGPAPLLVGFHGYGETAEVMMAALQRIEGARRCVTVSVQALHRFYNTKTGAVVGNWMTKLDREQAIVHNAAYVGSVLAAVEAEHKATGRIVFAGFSQGAAMAYRAAQEAGKRCAGVVVAGGDVPPDVDVTRLPPVLVGWGRTDALYTEPKLEQDLTRLRDGGADVEVLRFDGGHEWSPEVSTAAGAFLRRVLDHWPRP